MGAKEEALRQIGLIKDHMIDKQHFYPYNYNAMFVWSAIAMVLTLFMAPLYEAQGIVAGTAATSVLIALGFVAEGVMTKQVNRSYDIGEYTKRQRFVMVHFGFITSFLIVLSMTLASYRLYIPIYLSWLFLISLGYMTVGFVLNIRRFERMAQINMTLAMTMLVVGWMRGHLVGIDSVCFRIVQAVVIVGLTVMPAWIAWKQKKDMQRV